MIVKKLHSLFFSLIAKERCPHKLALSVCMGIYVAFCPFVGFHTLLVFLLSWLFALNTAVLFAVSVFINNPWTMIPVYGFGYIFGSRLFGLLGIQSMSWNPSWMNSLNLFLQTKTGLPHLSLGAFLIGGNIVGVALALLVYPIIKRIIHKRNNQQIS